MIRHTRAAILAVAVILADAATLNAQNGNAPLTLSAQLGHWSAITRLVVTTDGRFAVTASLDKSLIVWEIATGRQIRAFQWHRAAIMALAIDDSGNVVSGAEDGSLARWSITTGAIEAIYVPAPEVPRDFDYRQRKITPIYGIAVDSRQNLFAAARTDGVWLYDVGGGTARPLTHNGQAERAGEVAFLGDRLVSTARESARIRLWDVRALTLVQEFKGHHGAVNYIAVAPNSRFFVTTSDDSTAAIWTPDSSAPVHVLRHDQPVGAVAITPDSRYIVTSSGENRMTLWSADSGKQLIQLPNLPTRATAVAFDRSWKRVLTGTRVGLLGVVALDLGGFIKAFWQAARRPNALAVSAGQLWVSANDSIVHRWDLRTGSQLPPVRTHQGTVTAVAFRGDGMLAVTGASDSVVAVWDLRPGTERIGRAYHQHHAGVTKVAMDSAGRVVASATTEGEVFIWRLAPLDSSPVAETVRTLPVWGKVRALALSLDGKHVLTAGDSGIRVCETRTLMCWTSFLREGAERVKWLWAATFSPQLNYVLAVSLDGEVRIWDIEGNEISDRMTSDNGVSFAVFDPSGDWFYTAGGDKIVRRWRTASKSGSPERIYAGHGSSITALALSPDGSYLYSASDDGTAKVWRAASGELVSTVIIGGQPVGKDLGWTVVAPDGRFDSNALDEEENGLYWIMADDPMRPLPIEIFTRSHYEPNLLGRLLTGHAGAPLPDLRTLDRVQPDVAFDTVTEAGEPGIVKVSVSVGAQRGAYDLRLFRDGQLVATWPATGGDRDASDIQAWREAHDIALDNQGRARHSFLVHLPRGAAGDTVRFSAYAFNADRVKSETARTIYLTRGAVGGLRRAYIIAIGVGDNQDPNRQLAFAAHDAATVLDSLVQALEATHQFDSVVAIPLMRDPPEAAINIFPLPEPRADPTKANIATVLALLAGRPIDPLRRAAIPAGIVRRLHAAKPQDLVLLYAAAHGLIDPARREFVLLPMDIGGPSAARRLTGAQIARGISSSELTQWFQRIDAAALVMILSTCYSEAAVARDGFRPGPMGDPGLGQLAYDKGMQILVAAQSDAKAVGLTYLGRALVEDGLPSIRRWTGQGLSDLLRYAESHVPELIRNPEGGTDASQQPQLFDFRRGRSDVVLVR